MDFKELAQRSRQYREQEEQRQDPKLGTAELRERSRQFQDEHGTAPVPPRDNPLTTFGGAPQRNTNFGDSLRGGFKGYEASLHMAMAMGQDMFGLENDDRIAQAMQAYEHAADITAAAPTFGEFLDSPDFGNFADWFINTAGSFAPDVLESVTTAALGGVIGGKMAGAPGAAAGATYGAVAGRALLKANLRKEARESLQRVRDGQATAADRAVAHDLLRTSFAQRGAAIGTTAGGFPQMSGEAYRESVEAGDPSPWGAAATGLGAAVVGTAGEAYAIRAASQLMGQSLRTGSPLAEAGRVWLGSTGASTATEIGQEELLIRFRDTLEPGYAQTDEASSRRLEAGAAGAAMGATRATVFDSPASAAAAREVATPPGGGTTPPGGSEPPPGDDPSPGYRERFSDFMSRFDPATDERGFTTPRQPAAEQPATGQADRATADPAPGQQFTPPPEQPAAGQADPAPGQQFTPPPEQPTAGQADPAPGQQFTPPPEQPAAGRADPAPGQQFTQDQGGEPPVTRADVAQAVSQEQRRALREAGYTPRDTAFMTGPVAQAMVDGQVPVERFREEMARARSGGIVTEGQSDIDAQFASMLDDGSPKRGVEVPDGSPMPSALADTEGVHQVETSRGTFLTRDRQLAREVEEGQGDERTMARALGYEQQASRIDPRHAEVATVRDAEGNIVHSEAVDGRRRRQTEERLAPMGQVAFQNVQEHLLERTTRRAQDDAVDSPPGRAERTPDDRHAAVDSDPRDMRITDRDRQQRVTRDQFVDEEAQFDQQGEELSQAMDDALLDTMLGAPRDETGNALIFDVRNEDTRDSTQADAADPSMLRDDGGVPTGQTTTGTETRQRGIGVLTRHEQLDQSRLTRYDASKDVPSYRTDARHAPVRNFGWKTLTPQAARTEIMDTQGNMFEVPTRLMKDVEAARRDDPNADIEIVRRRNEAGDEQYTVVQRRDPMAREAQGLVDTADGRTMTARERIMAGLDRARMSGQAEHRTLELIAPNGHRFSVNPRVLGQAGVDTLVQRDSDAPYIDQWRMGLNTALAELALLGYQLPVAEDGTILNVDTRLPRPWQGRSWPTNEARQAWDALSESEQIDILVDQGEFELAAQLMEGDEAPGPLFDEDSGQPRLPDSVIQAMNDSTTLDRDDGWVADREGQQDAVDGRPPRQPRVNIRTAEQPGSAPLPETSAGARVDPNLPGWVGDIVNLAKRVSNLKQGLVVLTDGANLAAVYASLSHQARDYLARNEQARADFEAMVAGERQGAGTTMHLADTSVIFVRQGSPERVAMVVGHELGHVTFKDHLASILGDHQRFQKLYRAYTQDRDAGLVKQYDGDPRRGFEEWMADRYGSWLNRRTRNRQAAVARDGAFAQLRSKLRQIYNALQRQVKRLAREGRMEIPTRMAGNRTADQFFDGLARTAALQDAVHRLRREARTGARRFDPDLHAELLQAERDLARARQEWDRAGETVTRGEFREAMEQAASREQRRQANRQRRQAAREQREAQDAAYRARETAEDQTQALHEVMFATDDQAQWIADLYAGAPIQPDVYGIPPQDLPPQALVPQEDGDGAGGQPPIGISNLPGLPDAGQPPMRLDPFTEAAGRQYDRARNSETVISATRWADANMPRFMKNGWQVFKNLWWSDDSRLREMGGGGRAIARMFWSAPGDRGDLGYLNARMMETGKWMQRMDKALEGLSPEQIDYAFRVIQEERPLDQLPPQARPLHDLLQELGRYGEEHILGFQARQNYGTRVYNVGEIMSRTEEFQALLREYMPELTGRQMTDIIHTLTQEGGAAVIQTSDQAGSAPGLSARFARQLGDVPNKALADAGFLEDPKASIAKHIQSMVYRAEAETRFAGERPLERVVDDMRRRQRQGQQVDTEYLRQLEAQLEVEDPANPTMISDPMAKVKNQIDALPPEHRDMARKVVENYLGRSNRIFGAQMPTQVARIQSVIGAYVYMTTLGLATMAQFTDYATIAMRTRNPMAWRDMYQTLRDFPTADRLELAKRLGIVQSEMTMSALHNMYGNDYMTPGVRRMTDGFFKVIGLQAMTDFNRSLAAQMGIGFIKSAAQRANAADFEGTGQGGQRQRGQAPDPTALRHLEELGLTPDTVREWIAGGEDFDTPAGEAVRQAIFRFSDEAILRPNAAMRPGWASNPWFMLFWQLKSFAWGGKKVFIDGAINEFVQARREGKSVNAATAPMQMAAVMGMPLALLGLTARDMAKDVMNTAFDDDEYEWVSRNTNWASLGGMTELMDRAGLLGPASIAHGMYGGMEYGTPPLVGWAGPAAERAHRLAQGDYGRVARDSVPVAGLVL